MDKNEAQRNIGRKVQYSGDMYNPNGIYLLTGIMVRRKENKYTFQAELTDLNANSVIYDTLDTISEIGG